MRAAKKRTSQAYRPGTRSNHQSHALLYVAFTIYFSYRDVPAASETLLRFAEFLLRSYTAVKSITNALSPVRCLHCDLQADTQAFDSNLLAGWKRALPLTFRNPESRAPPLPLALLQRLCQLALTLGHAGQVFAALMAVCFFSMARLSSLVPEAARRFDDTRLPTWGDLRSVGNGFHLNLRWSKTRQSLLGDNWVLLLSRASSFACPVAALETVRHDQRVFHTNAPLFSFLPRMGGGGGSRFPGVLL